MFLTAFLYTYYFLIYSYFYFLKNIFKTNIHIKNIKNYLRFLTIYNKKYHVIIEKLNADIQLSIYG